MSIRDLGLAIVRRLPWANSIGRKVYALLPASLHDTPTSRAQAFFAGEPSVTFMQIGTYDGVAGDPIRPLVLEQPGWTGVLVEPQPDVFARLQRNYASEASRLQFLNAAISDKPGKQPFYFIPRDEMEQLSLPAWAAEIASFDADHLRKHFPSARIDEQNVTVMTFEQAASRLPDGRVDLVVLDVEGHESAIIPAIDLDRYRVRFLIYEHMHMSAADGERLGNVLRQLGFKLKPFGRDTIAWRSFAEVAASPAKVPWKA
jgi:FkbM family methyltransferase